MSKRRLYPVWLKPLAHLSLALPLLWMIYQWGLLLAQNPNDLGVNPIEATIRFFGDTAIRVLLAALAVTPLAQLTGFTHLMRIRRAVGLWAFAYAVIHFLSYFGMDQFFSLALLWEDVLKRKYITFGMAAILLLLPLAVTSTNAMLRRLGGRNWQRLHRLVYVAAVLAVIHHWFMVKGIQQEPIVHGVILAGLLGYRLLKSLAKRRRRATA